MADSKVSFYSFDKHLKSIDNYLELFNVYCDWQELKADKKQEILLISLTPELDAKLKELVRPQEAIKIYVKDLELLVKLYTKPSNITTRRYTFHRLVQQISKPINEYVEQVRKQAKKCKFGSFEKEAWKDQLVLNI